MHVANVNNSSALWFFAISVFGSKLGHFFSCVIPTQHIHTIISLIPKNHENCCHCHIDRCSSISCVELEKTNDNAILYSLLISELQKLLNIHICCFVLP